MYEGKIQLLKTSTSNDVEQEMNRFSREQIRSALPLHFFQGVANLWRRLVKEATETSGFLLKSKDSITPYAKAELLKRLDGSKRFQVLQNNTGYVTTVITADERRNISMSHSKISSSIRKQDHTLLWKCDY
jgi:hypothetical protein